MKLNPAFKKVFVDRMSKALAGSTVWGSRLFGTDNADDWKALATSFDQKVLADLSEHTSETPIVDFTRDFIERRLDRQVLVPPVQMPLPQMEGFNDLEAVAGEIFDALSGFPFEYALIVGLPISLSDEMPSDGLWKLSDQFQIARGAGLHNTYDVHSINDDKVLNHGREHHAWSIRNAHLIVHTNGFVSGSYLNHPLQRTMEAIRGFFGLCIALELLKFHPLYLTRNPPPLVMIDRRANGEFVFDRSARMPSALTSIYNGLLYNKPPESDPPAQWFYVIGKPLVTLKYILSAPKEDANRMVRAAQWYFDSLAGDNELLQFVQAMVALEILIGGTKEENARVGIGELMRNRIAYLIGKSIEERRVIMRTFDAIYDVRSSIVHAGHSRLTNEQRGQLWTLRDYVARVIRAEAKLLKPLFADLGSGWADAIVEPYVFGPSYAAAPPPTEPKPPGIFPKGLL